MTGNIFFGDFTGSQKKIFKRFKNPVVNIEKSLNSVFQVYAKRQLGGLKLLSAVRAVISRNAFIAIQAIVIGNGINVATHS